MRVDQTTAVLAESETPDSLEEPRVDAPEALVEEDLLIEDVSIDGMCGVY